MKGDMEATAEQTRQIEQWNEVLKGRTAEEVTGYFLDHFGQEIVLSSSMGQEDQVLTHMVCSHNRDAEIFTLDSGRLFPETYELIDRTNQHFGIRIRVYYPDARKVEGMVSRHGVNLFYESVENRKLCCGIRKVAQLPRAFSGKRAWICGLRKDQSVARFFNKLVEWDDANGLIRINPLINWSEKEVRAYIEEHRIPYNELHDKGYPSIGCQPCTRAIAPGEDVRAGRWWWENEDQKECGLHKR